MSVLGRSSAPWEVTPATSHDSLICHDPQQFCPPSVVATGTPDAVQSSGIGTVISDCCCSCRQAGFFLRNKWSRPHSNTLLLDDRVHGLPDLPAVREAWPHQETNDLFACLTLTAPTRAVMESRSGPIPCRSLAMCSLACASVRPCVALSRNPHHPLISRYEGANTASAVPPPPPPKFSAPFSDADEGPLRAAVGVLKSWQPIHHQSQFRVDSLVHLLLKAVLLLKAAHHSSRSACPHLHWIGQQLDPGGLQSIVPSSDPVRGSFCDLPAAALVSLSLNSSMSFSSQFSQSTGRSVLCVVLCDR